MTGWMIWAGAATVYLGFRLWYDGWRRPLSAAEVDAAMADIGPRMAATGNDPAIIRQFLENDDGREFVMLNLVKAQMGDVVDPATGDRVTGLSMLQRYSRRFMPVLLRNGGHPGMVGRKIGGYVDAWNVEGDPGWTVFGLMRYRSRRDMLTLVRDPAFVAAHPEKLLGTAATFSFPTQRMVSIYASPRVTAALVCALAAALGHLAVLSL